MLCDHGLVDRPFRLPSFGGSSWPSPHQIKIRQLENDLSTLPVQVQTPNRCRSFPEKLSCRQHTGVLPRSTEVGSLLLLNLEGLESYVPWEGDSKSSALDSLEQANEYPSCIHGDGTPLKGLGYISSMFYRHLP